MAKLDKHVAEVGPYTVFRKVDSREYEIVGPAVPDSPIGYTIVRMTPEMLEKIRNTIRTDVRRK